MWRILEKFAVFFLVIVFLTFLVNHGSLDFSGVDFVYNKTKDSLESEDGKKLTAEVKDISYDVADELIGNVKDIIASAKASDTKQPVELIRVVDGDTLVVKLEDEEIKVRLIGIDTPESVHTDESKNTIYGTYASDYTKNVLSDTTTLYLEFDEDTEDIYGRTLAYVWLKDDVSPTTDNIGQYMLNGILLHDGYAMDKVYEPNDRYAANFSLLRENAEKSQTGLWEFEEFQNLWTEYLKAS